MLAHHQLDARNAVDQGLTIDFCRGIHDIGNLVEVDRSASIGDQGAANFIEVVKSPWNADADVGIAAIDAARGQCDVGSAERLNHFIEAETQGADLVRIDLYLDLAFQAAPDVDGGHTFEPLEAELDLVIDELAQGQRIEFAADAENHDRECVGIELQHDRFVGIGRHELADASETVADVIGCAIQVGAPDEADADDALAFPRGGGKRFDARNRCENLLDRLGDQLFDFFGACVFVGRDDGERRQA